MDDGREARPEAVVVPPAPAADGDEDARVLQVAEDVRRLLVDLGEDPEREGLRETPLRVARMYVRELLVGRLVTPAEALSTVFREDFRELVLVRDIPFYALCEHHLMPFFGRAHVGYLPDGAVVGLSKLARLIEALARRLTIQERLTTQAADALMEVLKPQGAMVVVEAEHFCMTMRGVQKPGTITTTSAARGIFAEDSTAREEFLRLVRDPR
ncbi:MAG: GTP cyclohydrolase I FolE [Clostridia bacterium]|nr:GTP cyclohydrolase I FolE [Clostridia bacterium]